MKLLKQVSEGFGFKCQACGRCCKGKGEGFVFLYNEEIRDVIEYLNITVDEFFDIYADVIETEYVIFDDEYNPTTKKIFLKSIVLKQNNETGTCVFLDDNNLCKIYDVRPLQCKTWPSWYMIMTKNIDFKNALKKCPGFCSPNTEGCKYISKEDIIMTIKQEIDVEQEYIKKMKLFKSNFVSLYPFLNKAKITK